LCTFISGMDICVIWCDIMGGGPTAIWVCLFCWEITSTQVEGGETVSWDATRFRRGQFGFRCLVPLHIQHVACCYSYDTRTLWPAMVKWDGKCSFRFISIMRIPFETLYLNARVRCSSCISRTSPYFIKISFIIRSFTSGGRLAIRILRLPIQANSIVTCDNSPLSCLNPWWPFVAVSTLCRRVLCANLMNTCRLVPSICTMRMFSSSRRSFSKIHSWIWKAVTHRLRGSKQHNRIFPVAHSKLSILVVWGYTYKHSGEVLHAEKHQMNTELTTVSTPHNRTLSLLNADLRFEKKIFQL
jgi:hypothetical protein